MSLITVSMMRIWDLGLWSLVFGLWSLAFVQPESSTKVKDQRPKTQIRNSSNLPACLYVNHNFQNAANHSTPVSDSEIKPIEFGCGGVVNKIFTPWRTTAIYLTDIQHNLTAFSFNRQ